MGRLRDTALAAVAFVVLALCLGGCGGTGRSTAAFCNTMRSEQQQILAQLNATAAGGGNSGLMHALAGLGASVQAIGALRTYFDELSDVAPPPIEDDAKIVAQAYDQQFSDMGSSLSHPFSSLFGALVNGMATSSQLDAMNQFALQQCGHSI
jgi:hypothetical protein